MFSAAGEVSHQCQIEVVSRVIGIFCIFIKFLSFYQLLRGIKISNYVFSSFKYVRFCFVYFEALISHMHVPCLPFLS